MEEVLSIINNLEHKNSSGYDDISNKLLKSIKEKVCTPLTVIINQFHLNGIFPEALKIAIVKPISHFYLQYQKKFNVIFISSYTITLIKIIYSQNNSMVLGLNILQSWQQ